MRDDRGIFYDTPEYTVTDLYNYTIKNLRDLTSEKTTSKRSFTNSTGKKAE